MDLGQALHDEIVRLGNLVEFNLKMWRRPDISAEVRHEYFVIAHVQESLADRLQLILHEIDTGEYHTTVQEDNMNAVKSLANTGVDYCQFIVEVVGGEWGQPDTVALIEKSGSCGGGTEKRIPLTNFALPVALPNGKYTMQAKVVEAPKTGGCGGVKPGQAHIQFARPFGTPSFVKGNRSYGWAFETNSPELIAALLK